MTDDLTTYAENTWCPGCGNFGILNAFKTAVRNLEDKGLPREKILITSGIGCHAKIFDYLALSGFYSIHGRSMTTAQGMKLADPDLKVVAFAGDGDALGEGIAHVMFAAKRNADITLVVHDNGVYGLTTGQVTPTSAKGSKGPSTPEGSIEDPLNPLVLALDVGATFVARGYPGKLNHLADIFVKAIQHEGFSFVHILQPCVSYNNTYKLYNSLVREIDGSVHDLEDALNIARMKDSLPIGVIYQTKRPTFHGQLLGRTNPVKDRFPHVARREAVRTLVTPRQASKGGD